MKTFGRGSRGVIAKFISAMLVTVIFTAGCGSDEQAGEKRGSPRARATGDTRSPSPAGQSPGARTDAPENQPGQKRTIGGVETVVRGQASTLPGSVDIEAFDNYFKPNILTGIPGTAIVAAVNNKGKALHNFSIPGQQVDQDVKPGEGPSVVFTFPDSGRVVFFCKYHREDGMVGELQVT